MKRAVVSMWGMLGLFGCGGNVEPSMDASVADAQGSGPARDGATGTLPDHVRVTAHAVNLVNPEAAAQVEAFLTGGPDDALAVAGRAFYEVFGDDYDFLYLVSENDVGPDAAAGRYRPVHHPAEPFLGLPSAFADPSFGSAGRLQGAIALNRNSVGNGPTLHETLHRWSVFLDGSFGFGVDRERNWGAHWGVSSVHGQHGGFDAATLACEGGGTPAACPVGAGGFARFTVAPFNPNQQGGDGVPYAPMELYLMGLIPIEEVPSPILVLRDALPVDFGDPFVMEASGIREITTAEIVALHGARPPLPAEARALRAAFVLVTRVPAPDAMLAVVEHWSAIFGGDEDSSFLLSFADGTGGRATMDTRAPTPR
jgi:hypothetical protein